MPESGDGTEILTQYYCHVTQSGHDHPWHWSAVPANTARHYSADPAIPEYSIAYSFRSQKAQSEQQNPGVQYTEQYHARPQFHWADQYYKIYAALLNAGLLEMVQT